MIMKNTFIFIYTLIASIIACMPMYAGTLNVTGNLQREKTNTVTTPAVQILDCDGQPLRSIPASTESTKEFVAYPYNAATNIKFRVSRKENPEVHIVDIDTTMNNISYNNTNGAFSIALTRNAITPSRYNYVVKVFVGTESTPASEREYTLSGGGGAFPIGSVIAYMGNANTVAGLEEGGWFKCDGRAVSALSGSLTLEERNALSDRIGNNLPNLMGVFLRGLDENSSGVQDDDRGTRTGGENHANGTGTGVRSKQDEGFRSHNHGGVTGWEGDHNHGGNTGGTSISTTSGRTGIDGNQRHAADDNYSSGSHTHSISADGAHDHTISSQGINETRPDNVAVYWLIRGR
jgi:hypothetical protein